MKNGYAAQSNQLGICTRQQNNCPLGIAHKTATRPFLEMAKKRQNNQSMQISSSGCTLIHVR